MYEYMQICIFLQCITSSPTHFLEQKPNFVKAMSEFTCGMTQLEETQLSTQPPQGCLNSKGVVACSVYVQWEQLELCYYLY